MVNIYKHFKRKNRTSDSDLKTTSPEEEKEKSLCDEASHVDDAITHSPGEDDKIIEALDMTCTKCCFPTAPHSEKARGFGN